MMKAIDPKALEAAFDAFWNSDAETSRGQVREAITAYLAALPPVDVTGLVKELRENRSGAYRDMYPDGTMNEYEEERERAATALEQVARERDEWKVERDRIKKFLSEGEWDTIQSEQGWKRRAEAAERERDEARAILTAAERYGTVYAAVERVLDERSAWIARPDHETTLRVALAATIAANELLGDPSGKLADAQCALEKAEIQRDDAVVSLDAAQARIAALEREIAKADAIADSNYRAGAQAGFNAAQDDDPNTALARLIESRSGCVAALAHKGCGAPPPPAREGE